MSDIDIHITFDGPMDEKTSRNLLRLLTGTVRVIQKAAAESGQGLTKTSQVVKGDALVVKLSPSRKDRKTAAAGPGDGAKESE